MISRKFVFLAAILLFPGISIVHSQDNSGAQASSQTDSLGDAARKARAEKKKEASKPAKVFTNDDMGGLKGTISVVGGGSDPQAAGDTANKAEDKKPGNDAKKDAGSEASWRAKFAAARKALAGDTKELDILQREFNLKQQQYYTDPTAALKEQNSREDLNKTQAAIDAKKQDVEKDKQALSDLEDALHKAGGSPRWADEASNGGSAESSDSGPRSSDGGSGNSTSANSGNSEP